MPASARNPSLLASTTAVVLLLASGGLAAAPTAYSSHASFTANLPGAATTIDFDSVAADTLIPSGTDLDGMTFSYNFGSVQLKVASSATAGYATTSGSQFLGTDDADILQDSDNLTLGFSASGAIGLYIISNDELYDNDVTLTAGGISATLVAADVQSTLADGSTVHFLGIIDPVATFTSATLTTPGNGEFLFNIDDIVTAPLLDTDGDSIPDVIDDDDDNDLLSDADEAIAGTNPLVADSDGDGVIDGEDQYPLDALQSGILGDIDGNTLLDVSDLLLLQRYLSGVESLSPQQLHRADVHPLVADDVVAIGDLLSLEQALTQ